MSGWKALLSDADIADVVTYERYSYGNNMGDIVKPEQVLAVR